MGEHSKRDGKSVTIRYKHGFVANRYIENIDEVFSAGDLYSIEPASIRLYDGMLLITQHHDNVMKGESPAVTFSASVVNASVGFVDNDIMHISGVLLGVSQYTDEQPMKLNSIGEAEEYSPPVQPIAVAGHPILVDVFVHSIQ